MRKSKRDLTIEQKLARGPVDLPFLMLVLLLSAIGLVMVLSASYASAYYDTEGVSGGDPFYYFKNQAFFLVLGVAVMYIVSRLDYQYYRVLSVPLLGVALVLLILVLTPLGVTVKGATRWLHMALVAGPTYQPSEIAKMAVIMFFSARLSKRHTQLSAPKKFNRRTFGGRLKAFLDKIGLLELIPYVVVLGVVLALMYKEPHMSGMILVLVGAAAVLFASGIHMGWFLGGGSAVGAVLLTIMLNTSYQSSRITSWLDPWSDPRGDGWQLTQSILAISSGGLLGVGLGNSRQKFLFLPEEHNDFIFAVVCEELGLVGAGIILLLFALLIFRGYWLALHARDRFGTLLIVGTNTLLAAQVFLNVGVVTGLLPTTGISLPFFSYGGTALVIQLAQMGVILGVSRQIPAPKT